MHEQPGDDELRQEVEDRLIALSLRKSATDAATCRSRPLQRRLQAHRTGGLWSSEHSGRSSLRIGQRDPAVGSYPAASADERGDGMRMGQPRRPGVLAVCPVRARVVLELDPRATAPSAPFGHQAGSAFAEPAEAPRPSSSGAVALRRPRRRGETCGRSARRAAASLRPPRPRWTARRSTAPRADRSRASRA